MAQKNTADAVRRADARLAKHPKIRRHRAGRTDLCDCRRPDEVRGSAPASDRHRPGYMPAYYFLGQIYVRQKRLGMPASATRRWSGDSPTTSPPTPVADAATGREQAGRGPGPLREDPPDRLARGRRRQQPRLHACRSGTDLDIALQLAQTAISAFPTSRTSTTRSAGSITSATCPRWRSARLQCAERVPKNPTYRYHLGMAYLKTGEPQKGRWRCCRTR